MNVGGVVGVVELAKELSHLQAFVDVSTAYCNCHLPHIEEKVYSSPESPAGLISICKVCKKIFCRCQLCALFSI